jgi:hypothetical protein
MRRQPLLASILLPETPEGMSGLARVPRRRTAVVGAEPHEDGNSYASPLFRATLASYPSLAVLSHLSATFDYPLSISGAAGGA